MAVPEGLRRALGFTLPWEGGFVNHPNDPGGPTNKGVTQRVYDAYRKGKGLANRSVRQIQDAEVQEIYLSGYWTPSRAGEMESPLSTVHFDTAVNFGVAGAVRFIQRALGINPTGNFGPITRGKLQNADQSKLALSYCALRIQRRHALVKANPRLGVFLKGWLNRDRALEKHVKAALQSGGQERVAFDDAEAVSVGEAVRPLEEIERALVKLDDEGEAPEEVAVQIHLRGDAAARYHFARQLLSAAYGLSEARADARLLLMGTDAGLAQLG